MEKKYTLKKDAYRVARGGYARFLNVYCGTCGTHLFLYQKDGPGPLLRAYLDRIVAPENLSNLERIDPVQKVPDLICRKCETVIGTPYIWEEETRKAYLLMQDKFIKKVGKGIYPPEHTTLD